MSKFIEVVFKSILYRVGNESVRRKDLKNILEEELGENIEEYEYNPILEKTIHHNLVSLLNEDLLILTELGQQILQNPNTDFNELWNMNGRIEDEKDSHVKKNPNATPYFEALDELIKIRQKYNINLRKFLKSLLTSMNVYSFESLVMETLVAAKEAPYGIVTKKSGDGGIDGYLFHTLLKQGEMPVQIKRYNESILIQEQEIRDFIGSWSQKHTNGAYFVTTSSYTRKAISKANERGIILLDGDQLVELMVKYKIGFEQKDGLEDFYIPKLETFN